MTSILFRLYTEHRDNLPSLVSQHFDGFTLYRGVGYWRGSAEESAMIEILGTSANRETVFRLAEDIRATNHQQSVYVASHALELVSVTEPQVTLVKVG